MHAEVDHTISFKNCTDFNYKYSMFISYLLMQTKFEEMIDSFSTKSSQTIGMIISELDQIEEEFSVRFTFFDLYYSYTYMIYRYM